MTRARTALAGPWRFVLAVAPSNGLILDCGHVCRPAGDSRTVAGASDGGNGTQRRCDSCRSECDETLRQHNKLRGEGLS